MGEIVRLEEHRPAPQRGGGNAKGTRRSFGSVRKLPSGRFQARYTAPDGSEQRASVTFVTKGDAATWLSMQHAAITEHRWKPPAPEAGTTQTFSEYAEAWLKRRELKPRTRTEYRRLLDVLTARFGDQPLGDISALGIRDWYDGLDASRRTQRAHLYGLLRTILGTAVEEEQISVNPCHIRGAGKAKRARSIRPASLEELRTMANALPQRWRMLLELAAWCALRFGELTELRRSDVDMKAGVIRVRRGVTWVDGSPVVGQPKSEAGSRDVTVPPHLVAPLRDHMSEHAEKGRGGLLFPAVGGTGHLNHGTFYKAFRAARTAAEREDLRLHDMRHTGAVMAAQVGATTRELMDRLGHSTSEMAMRYQHVADGRQADIARRLSLLAKGDQS